MVRAPSQGEKIKVQVQYRRMRQNVIVPEALNVSGG